MHVLVVDDDQDLLLLYRVTLESDGHTVSQAATGPAAVAAAMAEHFDLVLLDMMLPGQDGFDVLSELMVEPRTADLAVVVVSARTAVEDQVRSLRAGAVSYLTKPFSIERLLTLVDSIDRLDPAERQRLRDESLAGLAAGDGHASS